MRKDEIFLLMKVLIGNLFEDSYQDVFLEVNPSFSPPDIYPPRIAQNFHGVHMATKWQT